MGELSGLKTDKQNKFLHEKAFPILLDYCVFLYVVKKVTVSGHLLFFQGGLLEIVSAKYSDRGLYICDCMNEVGRVSRKILLGVQCKWPKVFFKILNTPLTIRLCP